MNSGAVMNVHDRALATLEGRQPDRIPFLGRMDFWHRGLSYQGRIPAAYRAMGLSEIHQAIGFGREEWFCPFAYRYNKTELILRFEDQVILHEYEPEISYFPDLWGMIPVDRAGETTTELITPVGKLVYRHRILEDSVRSGTTRPPLTVRPIRSPDDFKSYEYIVEHSEFVSHFDDFSRRVEQISNRGYVVPALNRVPFQSLLIDAIGEIPFFIALHNTPQQVNRLLQVVDLQTVDLLEHLSGLAVPYVEFVDNLDGTMTNPRLFEKYLVPCYRRYNEILRRQGKKLGSHTDGNLKNLVSLLPESGIDVCESFTPAPITACTFEEAWAAWAKGPLIWGGIPSYCLEARVPDGEFQKRIETLLTLVRDHPIILGIGDAVMSDNEIERVRWIAQRVEGLAP